MRLQLVALSVFAITFALVAATSESSEEIPTLYPTCVREGSCVPEHELYPLGNTKVVNPVHFFLFMHAALRRGAREVEALLEKDAGAPQTVEALKALHTAFQARNTMVNNIVYDKLNKFLNNAADGLEYQNDSLERLLAQTLEAVEHGDATQAKNKFARWWRELTTSLRVEEDQVWVLARSKLAFVKSSEILRAVLFKHEPLVLSLLPWYLPRLDPVVRIYVSRLLKYGLPHAQRFEERYVPVLLAHAGDETARQLLRDSFARS